MNRAGRRRISRRVGALTARRVERNDYGGILPPECRFEPPAGSRDSYEPNRRHAFLPHEVTVLWLPEPGGYRVRLSHAAAGVMAEGVDVNEDEAARIATALLHGRLLLVRGEREAATGKPKLPAAAGEHLATERG